MFQVEVWHISFSGASPVQSTWSMGHNMLWTPKTGQVTCESRVKDYPL
jgi:hypothetical protein